MTWFDSAAALILGLSLVYSVARGMVKEIFSLLAYVGGYLAAVKYQDRLAEILSAFIPNATASALISSAGIFLVTVVGISFVGKGFRGLVHSAPGLSAMDRLLGGAIGLVKGLIILVILMFPLNFFPDLKHEFSRDSFFAPHLQRLSQVLADSVDANQWMDKLPDLDLDEMKEKLKNLTGMDKLAQELKSGRGGSSSGHKDSPVATGKPQEDYTQEDKDKLNDILLSLDKN